jgi:hypothetical protein
VTDPNPGRPAAEQHSTGLSFEQVKKLFARTGLACTVAASFPSSRSTSAALR